MQIVKIIDDDDIRNTHANLLVICFMLTDLGGFPRVSKSSLPLICPVNALN